MIPACDLVAGWYPQGAEALRCLADANASLAATIVALLVLLVTVGWLLRRIYVSTKAKGVLPFLPRYLLILLVPLAAICAAVAAGGPALVNVPKISGEHVIVVVDQSASAMRRADERSRALKAATDYLAATSRDREVPPSVSVIYFAATPSVALQRGSADAAARLLLNDTRAASLQPGQSEIAAALMLAQDLAVAEPDGDAIILLSDGNDTSQDLVAVVDGLAGALPPTYVLPIDAGAPAEGIISAYLPPLLETGANPKARVVFDPGDAPGRDWMISVSRNGEAIPFEEPTLSFEGAVRQVQLPVRFEGRGVQFAELGFSSGGTSFGRRLFTLVKSPIRVLARGDVGFLSGLPEEKFTVTTAGSIPDDLGVYDVIVLGSIEAEALASEGLKRLARDIETAGLGLLLVNGPLRGAVTDPTVVMSYEETPISPLLPVSANPRFLLEEPPPRDIIVMVDTSGSMAGTGLNSARRAIRDISSWLRPQDRIQVITFALRNTGWLRGDSGGKAALEGFLASMSLEGESDASKAFAAAANETGNYAASFLITDGYVSPYDYRRDGMTFIYLEVGSGNTPTNAEIVKAANQSKMLNPGQGLAEPPDFFKPKERTEFYLPDPVRPVVVQPIEGIPAGLGTPGVALTYARADAVRALVASTPGADPILAFRDAGGLGGGRTAAFLSAISGDWTATEAGRTAIGRVIEELTTWSRRDRYDIRFTDLGSAVGIRISVLSEPGATSLPGMLTASLVSEQSSATISLTAVEGEPGVFEGRMALPTLAEASSWTGALVIEEGGAGAVPGKQVIPVTMPPASASPGDGREATTSGINRAGLMALAEASSGAFERLPAAGAAISENNVPPLRLHLFALAAAVLLFGIGMWDKGMRL